MPQSVYNAPSPLPARRANDRLSAHLTGLRGLAALTVVASHSFNTINGGRVWLAGTGQFGVWLFFGLSGFLLAWKLEREWQHQGSINWWRYLSRRLLRIYPLLGLCALAMAVLGMLTWTELPEVLLLLDGPQQLWTIPVECRFYLLLPLLWLGASRWRWPLWIAGLGLGLGVYTTGLLQDWNFVARAITPADTSRTFLAYLPAFWLGAGAGLGLAQGRPLLQPLPPLAIGVLGSLPVLPLLLSAIPLGNLLGHPLPPDYLHRWYLPFAGLYSLLFLALQQSSSPVGRALTWLQQPVWQWLGALSYPLYLFHPLVLHQLEQAQLGLSWGGWPRFALCLLLSLAIAQLLHHVVERPCLRWAHRS